MLGLDVPLRQLAPKLGGTDANAAPGSNICSTTGASSLCSQMAASRRLGSVRRRLFGRSVAEERFLWQEIAGYVSGRLFYLRTRRG